MAHLSESIAARSTSHDRERTREQAEVPGTSDMFFKALELFKNSVSRREFKNSLNIEERLAWLTWHLNRNNK